jgi:glycosyltransferase involved in cell wall biosynthesis
VVSPVYGCAQALLELCERLHTVLEAITPDYEIILVNDASPDDAWTAIQAMATADARVKGINLSRNFGQHYAITAGLDFAAGNWVVVMDCDLQDVPEEIARLYQTAQSGYDIVVGRRAYRNDHWLKKILSRNFYRVFAYFSGTTVDNQIGNFGIYAQKVIRSIRTLREQNRSFGLFAIWVGFERTEIDIEHAARPYGRTSYTFRKMAALAIDSIIAHSDKLLRLTVKLGLVVSVLSLVYAAWIVLRYFLWATPIIGWTSLIVSVYFTAGLIIGTVGIVGLYVGKIFDEVKGRPLYIVDATTFEMSSNDQ